MTPKTGQDPTTTVEALEAEIEELERQRAEALAQMRSAEKRFAELEERRFVLSPKTFSGDKKAVEELEQLEDEHDRLARSARVAKAALPEFDRMLADLKERREQTRRDVHMDRYGTLLDERETLSPRAEELVKELKETLDRRGDLYAAAGQELRKAGEGDQANAMLLNGPSATKSWLEERLWPWLR